MRIYTHISSNAIKCFLLAIWDILFCFGFLVLLAHAKIHYMDHAGSLGSVSAKEEVVRLDVTVDEVLFVDCLNSRELDVVSQNIS